MTKETILLKLSGESLANKEKSLAIDYELVKNVASQLKQVVKLGYRILIVVGGGNFWRGTSAEKNGIMRTKADCIGMLATLMNGLALESGFKKEGLKTRVLSSIDIDSRVCEYYVAEKAKKYLDQGNIIIFVGGTGRPYFTTDSASTLFAAEMGARKILVGKNKIAGVYDADPKTHPNAKHFETLTYHNAIEKNLKVMDSTAFTMAQDNDLELLIFDIKEEHSIVKVINGNIKHTKVVK